MAKRGKFPKTVTIEIGHSRTRKFRCKHYVFMSDDGYQNLSHPAQDGMKLHYCDERYGVGPYNYISTCKSLVCEEHWAEHQEMHTLHKLGGN